MAGSPRPDSVVSPPHPEAPGAGRTGDAQLDPGRPAPAGPGDVGDDVIALDEALQKLEARDRVRSDVVKLRYFAGLTIQQAADVLGISPATVSGHWTFARAWLFQEMRGGDSATAG